MGVRDNYSASWQNGSSLGVLRTVALAGRMSAVAVAAAGALLFSATTPVTSSAAVEDSSALIVALVGDTAPTAGGPTYTEFDEPMVDAQGNVVFVGFLSDTKEGVFYKSSKKGSTVKLVAASNVAIPGIGTPGEFDGPAMSSNGIVAFAVRGATGVAGVTGGVVRATKKKGLEVIAKTGDVAPGTSGALFDSFDDLAVNNKGHVAFIATYTPDAGITFKTGLFLSTKKGIIAIVLNGDVLPGTGGGTQDGTDTGDLDGPWLNDKDDVAFAADFISAAPSFEGSIFLKTSKGALQSLLLRGASLLGGTVDSIGVGRPGLNNKDVLAASVEIVGGTANAGVGVASIKGGIQLCVLRGDAAPDTTATFDSAFPPFGNPTISGNTLEFHSELTGDLANPQGVFTCAKPTTSKPSVREAVLPSDPKPTGTWGSTLEEDSSSSKWVVFDDEDGTPIGVFITKQPGREPKKDKN